MSDLAKLLADLNGKKMDPVKKEKLRLELLRAQGPRKDMTTLTKRDIQHDLNADMLDGYHFYDFMQDPTTKVGQIIYRYGTGSTNYAAYSLGARATALNGSADNAIDGNVATYWQASTGGLGANDNGQWVNVDFGEQTLIGWTRITHSTDINYRIAVYKVQYSVEETVTPTTFVDLDTITSTDEVYTYYLPGNGITMRHLRYLCITDYQQWFPWQVREIEAYRPSEFNDLRALDIGSTGTVLSVVDGLPSWEATATPAAHKTSHENGGADEISVAGLSGELADPQTPKAHKTSHENGGADEISVAGLSGELADAQTPKTHATSHQHGGADEVATATSAANAIPKGDAAGKLDTWISDASTTVKGKVELATDGETAAGVAVQGNDARLSNARTPLAHNQAATTVTVADAANYYTGTEAETVLQEVGLDNAVSIHDNVAGEIDALTALTLPVMGDVLLAESSAASFAKRELSLASLALLRNDAPLNNATEGDHFIQYAGGKPTGWNEAVAATGNSTAVKYSYWYLAGGSGAPAWEFNKQSSITINNANDVYHSFYFSQIQVRDAKYTADLVYTYEICADNGSNVIDKTKYTRVELMWDYSQGLWKARGVCSDGSTTTTGDYYVLSWPLSELYVRIVINGYSSRKTMRMYISYDKNARTDTTLLSSTFTTFPTMGQVWRRVEMARGAGVGDYHYIGAVDYDTGNT